MFQFAVFEITHLDKEADYGKCIESTIDDAIRSADNKGLLNFTVRDITGMYAHSIVFQTRKCV